MKNVRRTLLVALLLGSATLAGQAEGERRVERFKVRNVTGWSKPGDAAFFFHAKMAIDADGAPNAYHPDGKSGLDDLANAGRPGHWWALVTDAQGDPVVQGPDDPAPGFYVSTTSLMDPARKETDPRRYVDATKIPFIVLPKAAQTAGKARLGDFCAVVNRRNHRLCFALFADEGPAGKIGEGSIALARALDVPDSARTGGVSNGIYYLVFPGSGNGKPRTLGEIEAEGSRLLKAWGGQELLEELLRD